MSISRLIAALLLLLVAAPVAAEAAGPARIYVMRHLEKGEGTDPPLSALGAANAERLAGWFRRRPLAAIYASSTRRAQETAAPLARNLGLAVKSYDPRESAALVEAVMKEKGPVLVVGHSNTVPDIVERLGGARPADLADDAFGDIFVISGKRRRVKRLRLGGE